MRPWTMPGSRRWTTGTCTASATAAGRGCSGARRKSTGRTRSPVEAASRRHVRSWVSRSPSIHIPPWKKTITWPPAPSGSYKRDAPAFPAGPGDLQLGHLPYGWDATTRQGARTGRCVCGGYFDPPERTGAFRPRVRNELVDHLRTGALQAVDARCRTPGMRARHSVVVVVAVRDVLQPQRPGAGRAGPPRASPLASIDQDRETLGRPVTPRRPCEVAAPGTDDRRGRGRFGEAGDGQRAGGG